MMESTPAHQELLALTAEIVAAYVGNHTVASGDLPTLITSVFGSLSSPGAETPKPVAAPLPAVPIKKSVGNDYIVCLEDGKKLKMLKRHLKTRYNLTPDEYRRRWGLPPDYPMVAPDYAARRSALAKEIGLGRKPAAAPAPEPAVATRSQVQPVTSRPVRVGGRRKVG